MRILRRVDAWIGGWLSPDRKPHDDWTIERTPEEMAAWRELPDPKPGYQEFVGIPVELPITADQIKENIKSAVDGAKEDDDESDFVRSESGAPGSDSHKVTYTRKPKEK